MLAGYAWGLFSDTLRADLFGADALLYALAGYAAGMIRSQIDLDAPEPLAATVFTLTWVYAIAFGFLGRVFQKTFIWVGWAAVLAAPFLNAVVAVLGAAFVDVRRRER
jgi:cell shape-determining protein MreD